MIASTASLKSSPQNQVWIRLQGLIEFVQFMNPSDYWGR